MTIHQFSLGGLQGWQGVFLGLAAALVFLEGGRQDVGSGLGMTSSAFWFLLALTSTGAVVWLGVEDKIWVGAFLGLTIFCLEVWLIRR